MKFSEKWLREWVNPDIDSQALVAQLTMAGLEVDAIEPVADDFSGVVVAEVLSCEAHADADKLSVCSVSTGRNEYQVVCGAPNVRAGLKVALAEVGALLPGNFKIKRAKLRGVESQGMLCSEKELGLSDNHEGIMELAEDAPVGEEGGVGGDAGGEGEVARGGGEHPRGVFPPEEDGDPAGKKQRPGEVAKDTEEDPCGDNEDAPKKGLPAAEVFGVVDVVAHGIGVGGAGDGG